MEGTNDATSTELKSASTDGQRELTKHELTLMYLPPKRNHNRRKKKVLGPNDLAPETVPLNDVRRTYPSVFASLTSRAGLEEMRAQFSKIVAGDDFTLVVTTVEGENPFGPVYREMKGLEAAIKFMSAYFQAVPDCIVHHTNLQFFKRKNGESVLKTDFTIGGCMAFKVVVDNADQVDDFRSAVEGLQGLQSAVQTGEQEDDGQDGDNGDDNDDGTESNEEAVAEEESHANSSFQDADEQPRKRQRPNHALGSSSSSIASHTTPDESKSYSETSEIDAMSLRRLEEERERLAKKKRVEVGDTEVMIDADEDASAYRNMLITSDSTNYQLGQRTEGRTFSTGGKMIFYMNKDKKLVKIDAQYSAQKTMDSCKYDSLNDLSKGGRKDDGSESPPTLTFTAIEGGISDDDDDEDEDEGDADNDQGKHENAN